MSEDKDNFEDIVNNMGDASNEADDFEHPIEIVEHYWKHFHKGSVMTKGLLIVEAITPTGNRVLHYETTKPSSSWEVLGMLEAVKQQQQSQDILDWLAVDNDDDDDEDDQ